MYMKFMLAGYGSSKCQDAIHGFKLQGRLALEYAAADLYHST